MFVVLKNCAILSELTGGLPQGQYHIVLKDDRIAEILPASSPVPEADTCLDMEGKYVLPGFFDMHIHLSLSGGDTLIDNAKTGVQQALDGVKFVRDTLMSGFTTIRDVGSYYNVGIELRNAINSGKILGPTIYASGRAVSPTEAGNEFFIGLYNEADGEEGVRRAVRQEMQCGADFIKVMGTGAVMNPGGTPGQPIYTLEELCALVKAAEFKDTYIAIHCHGTEAIKNAIRAGVRTIEHASILDDEAIEMLKGNEKTFLVPTLKIIHGLSDSVPESSTFMLEKARYILECVRTGIRKAYDAGLTMGFGTDTGATPLFHGENGDEFILRKEFWGMKEIDIIKQATINSATLMGIEKDYGTIEVGKKADLVAVKGDPLEDISVLRHQVKTVVKHGVVVRND